MKFACHCKPQRLVVTKDYYQFRRRSSRRIMCLSCGSSWKSNADYVWTLPAAPKGWETMSREHIAFKVGYLQQLELFAKS